ncbi:hypothetical protein GCM10007164_05610 [Luteimonas padinae]|uniref:LysM domain-containing protein n=1 Tax=Luteimonas padinae TaxID=1714359 RepID=A0ABV6T0B8_9GAMM|nr:hypothetical protein [Luteimonas padinae]GHD66605.1 hypothetical protein GCM10007164_05610 [Luteimonas padinae]
MSVNPNSPHGPLPHQRPAPPPPPPPPPPVETLPEASADEANRTVEAMDAQAREQFRTDVEALPAGQRQDLLNGLASRLDAQNLTKMHDAFGAQAVGDAVELRGSAAVRGEYRELTGGEAGPGLPQDPDLPGRNQVEASQIQRAQQDFESKGIGNGGLPAPYLLGTLAADHGTEPAYLGELVRLADEAGVLDSAMGVNASLYSRGPDGQYTLAGADADRARDGLSVAVGVAVERGVLSEGQIRHRAADEGLAGWADVAGRLGVGNVGRTDATRTAAEALQSLQDTHDEAKSEADKLDEELNTFLLRAGPLTDEQQAKFIEAFRTADDHAAIYAAEAEAGQALADHVTENRDALLEAAVRDPAIASQVVDTLGRLADSGHGELALDLLGEIQGVPDSALGEAFAAHADTLQGELFERISSAAAVEIVARHDGDLQAAIADLKEAYQPFKDVKGLFDGVKGGIGSFREGMEMMDAVAAGDFDVLKKLGDGFADSSPFSRAMSGVGVVLGAVKAGQSGQSGDYLEAVQGFASVGESGLNLLAGATRHLADAGRLAQHGDDAIRFATFASRLAPGLGVLASATSAAINVQKAAEDGNVGYALAAVGDVFGVLGSAVALVPGAGTAAGAIVSGIGAVISAIGGFIGDSIDKHQTREELRSYLESTGMDADTVELMLGSGEAQNNVAAELGVSGTQWQQMLADDPGLAYAPYIFKEVADAYGLRGEQAVELFAKLRDDHPDAMLELMKEFGEKPMAGVDYGPLVRDFLESEFPAAHGYGRDLEVSDTRPDGTPKSDAEQAEGDYAGIREGTLSEIHGKAEALLEANDSHEYRLRVLELLYADNRSDAVLELGIMYGVHPDELR